MQINSKKKVFGVLEVRFQKKFEKHIKNSVPHYSEGHKMITSLADYFLYENSICYDIGCSTGNLLRSLSENCNKKKIKYIGLEIEKKMFQEAKSKSKNSKILKFITLMQKNINLKNQIL